MEVCQGIQFVFTHSTLLVLYLPVSGVTRHSTEFQGELTYNLIL